MSTVENGFVEYAHLTISFFALQRIFTTDTFNYTINQILLNIFVVQNLSFI